MVEQVMCNALVASARYFMVATGLLLVFRAVRFFDIAHGALFTLCAYAMLFFKAWCGLPFGASIVLGVLTTAFFSICVYRCVYSPLRRGGASSQVLLLASLGVYVVVANTISLLWGDSSRTIDLPVGSSLDLLGAKIAWDQFATILAVPFMWGTLHVLLSRTKVGKRLRAVGDDPELAEVSGVHCSTVIMLAYVAGAVMVGLAGISVAVGINMSPGMGISALLTGVVVLIIGGARRLAGIAIAAVLVAGIQHLVTWHTGPQWQDPLAFLLLVAFLIVRPEGILGKSPQKASA
jgi:branched-chain amino acid transport system permease protein